MTGRRRERTFGALIGGDGVTLVEYEDERAGMRVVDHWSDGARPGSIDDAVHRLLDLVDRARGGGSDRPDRPDRLSAARLAVAIEQFGVFHHVMTLPAAKDEIIRPIVQREVQRLFGVQDAAITLTRRDATASAAPAPVFIGGAPRATIDALATRLQRPGLRVDVVTPVPNAIHALYDTIGGGTEPTAILVCLDGGLHLAFFLDGKLELSIDPPIALEGESSTVAAILDQVERGAVYIRQQFRGVHLARVLLAARRETYAPLAHALRERLGAHVEPLFEEVAWPAAVVAMGAVLEAEHARPLDIFPHPPTTSDRLGALLRGPNAVVTTAAAAALIAALWGGAQVVSLARMRHRVDVLQDSVRAALPAMSQARTVAERRADVAHLVGFVESSQAERAHLVASLAGIGAAVPAGVQFDRFVLARTASGWSADIAGTVASATGGQAVRVLDAFYRAVRVANGVASASLDQFAFPAQPKDTTAADRGPVTLTFAISLQVSPAAAGQPAGQTALAGGAR